MVFLKIESPKVYSICSLPTTTLKILVEYTSQFITFIIFGTWAHNQPNESTGH